MIFELQPKSTDNEHRQQSNFHFVEFWHLYNYKLMVIIAINLIFHQINLTIFFILQTTLNSFKENNLKDIIQPSSWLHLFFIIFCLNTYYQIRSFMINLILISFHYKFYSLCYQNTSFPNQSIQLTIYQIEEYRMMSSKKRSPNIEETQLYDKITKLETLIIDNISQLKKNKKYYECNHLLNLADQCEEFDPNVNYYDKFWKMFLMNEIGIGRISEMKEYLSDYGRKVDGIEELIQKHQNIVSVRCRKKSRRTAEQIEKAYNCPYPKCYRSYGSDVSLNLHIKIKHNGGSKTDREKAAEMIIEARQKCLPIPQFRINLPPLFIQDYIKNQTMKAISALDDRQAKIDDIDNKQGKIEYQQKVSNQQNNKYQICANSPEKKSDAPYEEQ